MHSPEPRTFTPGKTLFVNINGHRAPLSYAKANHRVFWHDQASLRRWLKRVRGTRHWEVDSIRRQSWSAIDIL